MLPFPNIKENGMAPKMHGVHCPLITIPTNKSFVPCFSFVQNSIGEANTL